MNSFYVVLDDELFFISGRPRKESALCHAAGICDAVSGMYSDILSEKITKIVLSQKECLVGGRFVYGKETHRLVFISTKNDCDKSMKIVANRLDLIIPRFRELFNQDHLMDYLCFRKDLQEIYAQSQSQFALIMGDECIFKTGDLSPYDILDLKSRVRSIPLETDSQRDISEVYFKELSCFIFSERLSIKGREYLLHLALFSRKSFEEKEKTLYSIYSSFREAFDKEKLFKIIDVLKRKKKLKSFLENEIENVLVETLSIL